MSRSCGIPGASLVSLLLLLSSTHSGLGENCIFQHLLLLTSDVSGATNRLKQQLLLDYPVSLPSNLEPDEHCFGLWQLHSISRELSRMLQIAGSELRKNITHLESRLSLKGLFEDCKLESDCVHLERTNVSMFLDSIPSVVKAVSEKMEMMKTALNFSNCTSVRCQPDSLNTPCPRHSAQRLGNVQTSKSAVLRRHHWLLIAIPLLVCLFSIVKFSGRVPFQPWPLPV